MKMGKKNNSFSSSSPNKNRKVWKKKTTNLGPKADLGQKAREGKKAVPLSGQKDGEGFLAEPLIGQKAGEGRKDGIHFPTPSVVQAWIDEKREASLPVEQEHHFLLLKPQKFL